MSISPPDMRAIDALCDRYERAWKEGAASLEEYLAQAPAECRDLVLRELAAVEMHYRRNSDGTACNQEEFISAHPDLVDELAHCFLAESQQADSSYGELNTTKLSSPESSLSDVVVVESHEPQGLQIRCPNCRSSVELLADTPYDEVTCRTCGSEFSLAGKEEGVASQSILQTFGRFELMSRLGVGGFGTVWKARDKELDRIVALKIPRRGQLRSNEIDYFFREARAAAQLRHPHIVAVHEIGHEDDTVFIVSDFVHGVTLSDWMTENRPSAQEIAELCATIADALHHAHQRGVIHRDLKPSNVMIDDEGQPRIVDFGLAKREAGEVTMTMEGQILGTAAYMSPEQAGGNSHWTDRRTDVYSLGVMLFQLATGELPFRGSLETQLCAKQMDEAPDPRKFNRHIPRDLATICLKCLEREANLRYRTAGLIADELRRFLHGEPIHARPLSGIRRAGRWAKRRPALAAAIALTVFLAIAGPGAALILSQQRQRIADQNTELIDVVKGELSAKEKLREENRLLHDRIDGLLGRVPGLERYAPEWQQMLIEEIVDAHYSDESIEPELALGSDEEQAMFHSAIGFLYAQLGREKQASEHLETAKSSLQSLVQHRPDDPVLQRALAECTAALAENTSDAAAARKAFAELLDVRTRQVKSNEKNIVSLVELLATQWDLLDPEQPSSNPPDQLHELVQLGRQVVDRWPVDPEEIYEAACRLTFRDPMLSRRETPSMDDKENRPFVPPN